MTTSSIDNFPNLTSTRWESVSNMAVRRNGAAAVAIDNDRVLVVGGDDGFNNHCPGEIYDISDNSWTPIRNDMPKRRIGCSGVLLEGNVYIFGGGGSHNGAISMDVFNVVTHNWEKTIKMNNSRNRSGAVGYGKNIFLFGGLYTDKVERFNINTKVWHTLPSMPEKRGSCCAVRIGKKVYLVGGISHLTVDVFNLDSMAWDKNDHHQNVMSMPRYCCCAISIQHYIFVIGGTNTENNHLNSAELFDTASNTWTTLPMQTTYSRSSCVAVSLKSNHVMVAGGRDNLQFHDTAEIIDLSKLVPSRPTYNQALRVQDDKETRENIIALSEELAAVTTYDAALMDVLLPSAGDNLLVGTHIPVPTTTALETDCVVTQDEYVMCDDESVLCDDFIIVD